MNTKELIVVMGISGSGKSTVGQILAKTLAQPFIDADDFHPKENVMKMSSGIPLDDDDRWPWLAAIVEYVRHSHRDHFVLGCSALKRSYRAFLEQSIQCRFVLLAISQQEAENRMSTRQGHFMKSNMVTSQLQTLEITNELLVMNGEQSIDEIIKDILQDLK